MIHVLRISVVAAFLAGAGTLLTPRPVLRATMEKLKALWSWLDAPAPQIFREECDLGCGVARRCCGSGGGHSRHPVIVSDAEGGVVVS